MQRYYSLYELRMKIYQELNIYTTINNHDEPQDEKKIDEQCESDVFDEDEDLDELRDDIGEKILCLFIYL